jgi:hypothetical protein
MDAILTRWARVLIRLCPICSSWRFWWFVLSSGAAGQGLLADADVGWHIRTAF